MLLDKVEVYIDRDPERCGLRARVFVKSGESKQYGPNLLPHGIGRVETALDKLRRRLRDTAKELVFCIDTELQRTESLNDKPIATSRDNYGFRSSGR